MGSILLFFRCTAQEKSGVKKANDLIHETSPYLLQHAYNPVNWKAWNTETLELAKKENKLLIISIGYSACHWCHVMEKESFENDSIAKLMNDNFISIKVDREERPDIDQIYMNAVQLLTGGGGWPLNCIALPDGRPIFGGTYFTKDQWSEILVNIANLYKESPQKAIDFAENLTRGIRESQLVPYNKETPHFTAKNTSNAVDLWKDQMDHEYGGFKGSTKFPMPSSLEFSLRYSSQFNDTIMHQYLTNTLTKIAYGGIYDQLGGGFSRYATDEKWHIPHFEKMLYDNAQLVSLYAKAYKEQPNALYKDVVTETLQFVSEELTTANGAFYSSLDADSKNANNELEEGAFYAWTQKELLALLGADYPLFKDFYNITDYGLWEKDKYVLIRTQSKTNFIKKHNLTLSELDKKINHWKTTLLKTRNTRNKPGLDDKILTSWNALMLQGYVDAYKAFGEDHYLAAAIKNANFLMQHQFKNDGGLYRSHKNGKSTINGYANDYATTIQSFMSLYEVTLDEKWLMLSNKLMEYVFDHFFDEKTKMFFFTSNKDLGLIDRKIEVLDNVIPSSNSMLGNCLFKLGHYFSNQRFIKVSEQMLNNLEEEIGVNPFSYYNWLNLMTNFTKPFYEVAVVGKDAHKINKKIGSHYLPNILVAGANKASKQPLLLNKFIEGETFIYVCVNGTCNLPQTSLSKALKTIHK